jgi:hypothetical protein
LAECDVQEAVFPVAGEVGLQENWHHTGIKNQAEEYRKAYQYSFTGRKVYSYHRNKRLCQSDENPVCNENEEAADRCVVIIDTLSQHVRSANVLSSCSFHFSSLRNRIDITITVPELVVVKRVHS